MKCLIPWLLQHLLTVKEGLKDFMNRILNQNPNLLTIKTLPEPGAFFIALKLNQ